jgi:ParB family transcriptional regulator, chromosome partitioning protein
MKQIVFVNPFRCRMWDLHDRDGDDVDEETCKAEIQSMSQHGQLVPVLGRALSGESQHDVELIYGARRLFVARHLNIPLAVELRKLTDQEAIIAMDIENRMRLDLSPYERGRCYLRWLRGSYFSSQEEIARALRISPAKVSRLVRIAQLPTVIVSAFRRPTDIHENWGLALADAWRDKTKQAALAKRARAIASSQKRPPPEHIVKDLLSPIRSPRLRASTHDEVVKDDGGRPLFRVRRHLYSVSIILPIKSMSDQTVRNVLYSVRNLLRDETPQAADNPNKVVRPSPDHHSGGERRAALNGTE